MSRFVSRFFRSHVARAALFCAATVAAASAQTSIAIHDAMQSLPGGPYLGQSVSTSGIVVGVMSTGGFYISEPANDWDSLRSTAEGMPIFPNTISACNSLVDGDVVTVVGTVVNGTAVTAANTPGTGIQPTSCTKTGTEAMSQSINLANFGALTTFGDALVYTGMSATDSSFVAISPTGGAIPTGGSAVVSSGQFWGVLSSGITTNNHMFRSPGIARDEYVPATAPATVPTWPGNPQRILIDTTTFGGTAVDITVGQTITCVNNNTAKLGATAGIGLIDYTLGYARLLIFKETKCSVSGTVATSVSAAADTTHFKVGTLDVNTFLGSASIFQTALAKATLTVKNVFGSPDIFALQEVGDQGTLQLLADAVNTANGGSTSYVATVVGTDTINSGFLVNTNTLKSSSFTEVGRGATYATASGGTATLWDHPPLVLHGQFVRVGKNYPVTVIDVHMAARDNIGDATLGPDIRAQRAAQAASISTLVQQYQTAGANVIVACNLNGYEFNDGYVDVTGIIDGSPAAATAVTLYQASNTTAALHDFTTDVTASTRYNIIERGNAAVTEHIFASATVTDSSTASASLASYVNTVTQPHFTTDYSAVSANDATTPAGLTPHDGFLVNFAIPPVPTTASITPTSMDFGDVDLGGSKSLTATVTNTTTFTSTVNITNIAISGTNAADFSQTSTCTSLSMGSTCTVTVTFKPTATGTRTGTLTATNDSTSDGTLTVSLTGNGLDTTATLTPTSATFPNTSAGGGVSAAQTFTVTNTSLIAIAINSASVTTGYTIAGNGCPASLASKASCTIAVTFTPTTAGAVSGMLTVSTGATANPTLTATLNGTGLPTTATLSPTAANFGNTILGNTSATQTFVWTNTSAVPLTISSVNVTGDFSIAATTCTGAVAAHTVCIVSVVFKPTVLRARTGVLTIASSSSANPTLTAALSGTGVADVQANVDALGFGNVDTGYSSAAQTVTVTNYTNAAIALMGVTISGDFADTSTCGGTLAGGGSCTVSVVFTPTATGARAGALVITTNDTRYPVITVALTGNGVDFAVSLAPTSETTIAGYSISDVVVTTTAIGGFNAPVTMSCATKAAGSVCSMSPSGFTLSGTTITGTKITTTSKYTVIGYGALLFTPGLRGLLMTLLGLLSAGALFAARGRSRLAARLLLALVALGLTVGAMSGCSGKLPDLNSPYTEPGTYDYVFTVTDGKLSHSATFSLTVTAK